MAGEDDDESDSELDRANQQSQFNLARRGFLAGALGSVAFGSLPAAADTGEFEELWSIPLSYSKTELLTVDADDDGTLEVAVGDNGSFGPGEFGLVDNGEFVWKKSSSAEVRPKATGDVNGDSAPEIIFAAKVAQQWVRPYTYDGDYLWSGRNGGWVTEADTDDFDDDDRDEVMSTTENAGYLTVWDDDGSAQLEAQDADLIEYTGDFTAGFEDIDDDGAGELLSFQPPDDDKRGIQVVDTSGGEATLQWRYGPDEPVKATFADVDGGSPGALAAYTTLGEVRAVDAGGSELWTVDTSLSNTDAALFDVVGDSTTDAVLWEGSSVAIVDGATQDVIEFSIDDSIRRVVEFGQDRVLIERTGSVAVVDLDGNVLSSQSADSQPRDIVTGDIDGDGVREAVLGFSDRLVAYRPGTGEAPVEEPELVEVSQRPPAAIETTDKAAFAVTVDAGSMDPASVEATAEFRLSQWGDDVDGRSALELPLVNEGIVTENVVLLSGKIPAPETISSPGYGLRFELKSVNINDKNLIDDGTFAIPPVTYAFENVDQVAVLLMKLEDVDADLTGAENPDGLSLEETELSIAKEVNKYYASRRGPMATNGFEFEFYDGRRQGNDADWYELDAKLNEYNSPRSDVEKVLEPSRAEQFLEDSINGVQSAVGFSSDEYDFILTISPGRPPEDDFTDFRAQAFHSPDDDAIFLNWGIHINDQGRTNDEYPFNYGTLLHEIGHHLGPFDLYDTDSLSDPLGDLGFNGLMASGEKTRSVIAPFSAIARTEYAFKPVDQAENAPWLSLKSIMTTGKYTIDDIFEKEYNDQVLEYRAETGELLKYVDFLLSARGISDDISEYIYNGEKNDTYDGGDSVARVIDDGTNVRESGVYIYKHEPASIDPVKLRTTVDFVKGNSERNSKTADQDFPDDPTLFAEDSAYSLAPDEFVEFELKSGIDELEKDGSATVEITEPPAENMTVSSITTSPPGVSTSIDYRGRLNRPTPALHLHAYDQDGNHVGIDHTGNEFENEIAGAEASGPQAGGLEWIAVPADTNVRFEIDTTEVQQWIEETNVSETNTDVTSTYQLALTRYGDNPRIEEQNGDRTIADSTTIVSDEKTIGPGEEQSAATKVTIDFDPDTLNPKGGGKWVTTYITASTDAISVEDIDISTVELNGEVTAVSDSKYGFVKDPTKDVDNDGTVEFIAKFPRDEVVETLEPGESVRVTISGDTDDDSQFIGSDRIKVKQNKKNSGPPK